VNREVPSSQFERYERAQTLDDANGAPHLCDPPAARWSEDEWVCPVCRQAWWADEILTEQTHNPERSDWVWVKYVTTSPIIKRRASARSRNAH